MNQQSNSDWDHLSAAVQISYALGMLSEIHETQETIRLPDVMKRLEDALRKVELATKKGHAE